MEEKPTSPIDVARQTLKQLALSKVPPTPDNFRKVYDEILGVKSADKDLIELNTVLDNILKEAGKTRPKYLGIAKALDEAIEKRNWKEAESQLRNLVPAASGNGKPMSWGSVVRDMVKQLETTHKGITASKKKEGLDRVLANFDGDAETMLQKVQALVSSWRSSGVVDQDIEALNTPESRITSTADFPASAASKSVSPAPISAVASSASVVVGESIALIWRDLLIKSLELGLLSQLRYLPELARSTETLLAQARVAKDDKEVAKLASALKLLWYKLEMNSDAQFKLHESLLRLLRLLVDNMSELVSDDKWLSGQAKIIRDIVEKPLNIELLHDAESGMKELIFKQGKLKHGLVEAKDALKRMAATFVQNLAEMTTTTGGFHDKIEGYHKKINSTDDITELNVILDDLKTDTRSMQLDALRSFEDLKLTQQKVDEAERLIDKLTHELDQASELAAHDFLTGALNRRGMDIALQREFARAERARTQLCVAMMDIDHFKRLNDTLGHDTGDEALSHLAKVTQAALRPTDVLARYGGEEFIIILPETEMEMAIQVMTRVQRELTKNIFMHQNEKVLITFSAGVAQRNSGEEPEAVMKRADMALYDAKHTGRNRVIGATSEV